MVNMSKCHCQGKNVIVSLSLSLFLSKGQKEEEVCKNKIFVPLGVIMEEALLIEISPLSCYIRTLPGVIMEEVNTMSLTFIVKAIPQTHLGVNLHKKNTK